MFGDSSPVGGDVDAPPEKVPAELPRDPASRFAHRDPDVDWQYGDPRSPVDAICEALDRVREVPSSSSVEQAVEAAYDRFRDGYLAHFPQGGDPQDHDEATRAGIEAAVAPFLSSSPENESEPR
jgi:hypothetical protein